MQAGLPVPLVLDSSRVCLAAYGMAASLPAALLSTLLLLFFNWKSLIMSIPLYKPRAKHGLSLCRLSIQKTWAIKPSTGICYFTLVSLSCWIYWHLSRRCEAPEDHSSFFLTLQKGFRGKLDVDGHSQGAETMTPKESCSCSWAPFSHPAAGLALLLYFPLLSKNWSFSLPYQGDNWWAAFGVIIGFRIEQRLKMSAMVL